MTTAYAVLGVYLLLLFGLALWSRRETTTLKGYYLAGAKLPYWVVAFSTNATGASGWFLIGLTGMGYTVGVQAFWVVAGQLLGIWLSWRLISRRLKILAKHSGAITIPDALVAPFPGRNLAVRLVAVGIILIMVTTYVTAQMVASGKAMSSFLALDYRPAVLASSIVIIAYTFVGGYKAVSYTDVLQGALMLAGLVAVPAVAISAAGGPGEVLAILAEADPGLLGIAGQGGVAGWVIVLSFAAIGLPYLGVPQLLLRYMSIADENQLRKARAVSVSVLFVFGTGAVLAGMAGRALFPDLGDSETVFPRLATELFPPLVTGVLIVVVLAAIMSTVDSLLLLASSAVVRDGLQQILGSRLSDPALARLGKAATLGIGVLGVALALQEVQLIFWFVLFAWSGLGCAFGPAVIAVLYDRKTTPPGVVAGMLGGFLTSVGWFLFLKPKTFGLYEAIPGFAAGMILTFVVSRLSRRTKYRVEAAP